MSIKLLQLTAADRKQLRELGIAIVYVFGSYAEGANTPLSDIDIGIVLQDPKRLAADTMPLYLTLLDLFSYYVPRSDRLDIVFLQRAPLELRYDVITHGTALFSISDQEHLDFEERTTLAYCDFRPLLRQFDRAIIENT